MVETLKNQRALFKSGEQRIFIESVEKRITIAQIASICACSPRTIRDWRREKFPMQLASVHTLSKFMGIPFPSTIQVRNRYAHVKSAGLKGARVVMAKYGRVPVQEQHRAQRWHAWWKSVGKFKPIHTNFTAKPIHTPRHSALLAEFIGIMMGDGGMSKYQTCITLHHIDDREYIDFVVSVITQLFHLTPSLYHLPYNSVYNIVVSRIEIVRYLHAQGLPIGNKVKQDIDIPDWIKRDKKFLIACIRGLIDTDGCVFTHSYKVKGRWYHYKKLSFCSHSKALQHSAARTLTDLGMHARIAGYDVRLDSKADMKKYFTLIGSHNPKHLKRYSQ